MTKEKQRLQQEIDSGLAELAEYRAEYPKLDKVVSKFLQENPNATAQHLVSRGFEDFLIKAGRSMHIVRKSYNLPHPPCTKMRRFTKEISNDEIQSGVIGVIAKRLYIKNPSIVSLDDMLINDYGANTLDLIDIQMDIEDKYGIEIPWDDVGVGMDNIGEIVHYVEQRLQKRQKPKNPIYSKHPLDKQTA